MYPPRFFPGAGCLFAALAFAATAQVNILTYHNDNSRAGQNLNEPILSSANVNMNTFGKLFSYSVDGYVYAQPLYVSGLNIPGKGVHNVIFIATEHNIVYAFDADSSNAVTGGLLWQTNLGSAAVTTLFGVYTNRDFGTRYNNNAYTDIVPEVGITGTPVIDLASGTLYVDAFTGEMSGGVTNYHHRLHALNITTGNEQPNSPVLVAASVPGTGVDGNGSVVTFDAKQQLQRSALTLAGGILYVCYAGYADTNPYHGWILGFDPVTLQQLTSYTFNTTPNSTIAGSGANAGEGGIWMGGGGLSVDANTNLFFEVGNGVFTATNNSGGTEYGDSFMKLSTTNGLAVADYFTPWNQQTLANNDTDVGSSGLLLLPDQPGPFPHLLLGAGKEGKVYVINRDQMTTNNNHYDSTNNVDFVRQLVPGQIGGSFDTPAYFNGRIYYAGSGNQLKAFSLTGGLLSTTPVSTGTRTYGFPGATPSVSANGTEGGVVWALQNANPAVLAAYNPTNLTTEIYNTAQAAGNRDRLANAVKFSLPAIANGKVYVGNQSSVSVLGLLDPYLDWKHAHFGSNATNSVVADDLADPDSDGAVNLLEYALASDPNTPVAGGFLLGTNAGNQFQVQFNRNTLATNITYVVQSADSLGAVWTDLMTYTTAAGWVANTVGATASESPPLMVAPDHFVTVTITDPASVADTTSRLFRLAVHR